jgi:hypothetical protein
MTVKVLPVDPYEDLHWLGNVMSAGDDAEDVSGEDREAASGWQLIRRTVGRPTHSLSRCKRAEIFMIKEVQNA